MRPMPASPRRGSDPRRDIGQPESSGGSSRRFSGHGKSTRTAARPDSQIDWAWKIHLGARTGVQGSATIIQIQLGNFSLAADSARPCNETYKNFMRNVKLPTSRDPHVSRAWGSLAQGACLQSGLTPAHAQAKVPLYPLGVGTWSGAFLFLWRSELRDSHVEDP
jgi:hypothetical protein